MPPSRVYFFDTTLRDGEQSPGCSMTQHEKLQMAHSLADLGVDILEAGFAISSDGDFAAIDDHCSRSSRPGDRLARAVPARRHRAGGPGARTRAAIADPRLSRQLRSSPRIQAEDEPRTRRSIRPLSPSRLARTLADDVEFSPEDSTRTDRDFLCKIVGVAIEAGAHASTCPTLSATPLPTTTQRCSA